MNPRQQTALSLYDEEAGAVRARLAAARAYQKPAFKSLRRRFAFRFLEVNSPGHERFLIDYWKTACERLERVLLPQPPFSFLSLAPLASMLREPDEVDIPALRSDSMLQRRPEALMEDPVGGHPRLLPSCDSSTTQIQHLKDLVRFRAATGCSLESLKTVVEWGGGYGSLAKCLRRLCPSLTLIIVDAPIVSCLQWIYLATIFGEDAVRQIRSPSEDVAEGRINLLPLPFVEAKRIRADLFVSTYALSESSDLAQDLVVDGDWFGAGHLLVAYDDRLRDVRKISSALARRGARLEPEGPPGSAYAFL